MNMEPVHRPIAALRKLLAAPLNQGSLPRAVRTEISTALECQEQEVEKMNLKLLRYKQKLAEANATVAELQSERQAIRLEKQDWLDQRGQLQITIGCLKEEIIDLSAQLAHSQQVP